MPLLRARMTHSFFPGFGIDVAPTASSSSQSAFSNVLSSSDSESVSDPVSESSSLGGLATGATTGRGFLADREVFDPVDLAERVGDAGRDALV